MAARILDGRAVALAVRDEVAGGVRAFVARHGIAPRLDVLLVGADPASQTYVRNKERAAARAGIDSTVHRLPSGADQAEILEAVERLNADPAVHGVLVQSPLPPGVDTEAVFAAVRPAKDVDGFHPLNLGRLVTGRPGLVACTPQGVMELLRRAEIPLEGADAVVVGRSLIVGRPMALLLTHAHATVTVVHSRTRDLAAHARRADLLVVAAGRRGLVGPAMVKPGATVVDVGIHPTPGGGFAGDVDPAVAEVAGAVTPVPGGVGPMTVAMLLRNTLLAAGWQLEGTPV